MPRQPRSNLSRYPRRTRNVHYGQENTRATNNNRRVKVTVRFAFTYDINIDYSNLREVHLGEMNETCIHCAAKKWKEEAAGMCCSAGKVILPSLEDPPEPLKSLLLRSHESSSHFLQNSRKYNTLFQMTSFGAKEIREGNFMPTFKIQGQVYHSIGSLLPLGNERKFLQIYFISEADQLSTRMNMIPNLNRDVIRSLQTLLNTNNNYIHSFKYNFENSFASLRDDFKLIIHADKAPLNEHRGRYNAPVTNEVAVLLLNEDKGPRDIILHRRNGELQRISETHRSYDALQYPLLFVHGEDGYFISIPQHNSNQPKTISCMQFYAYRFMIRDNCINHLHRFQDLFNQYCVDMMAKMISERLSFIRNNQKKLRADDYIHLRDAVSEDGNVRAENIGQRIILPSSFTGSPRYMHERTQDAMTYVRKEGCPDLFITFTCNPEWSEIKNELFAGQKSINRHDIIARVFHLKNKKLMQLLYKEAIFGIAKCYMYTIEWQKRGLPHAHILLWLENKIQPDDIDHIISAELPNKDDDPLLYNIVSKTMVHGPCGEYNITAPCMNNGKCSKRYPRPMIAETQTNSEGYPTYRRRSPGNGGNSGIINIRGQPINIDNRWIVPYCPVLSRTFEAHINVEYCRSVKAIKYVCKYVNKGSDQATFTLDGTNETDEIKNYLNGRYISTSEAFWRFFDFPIHERFPAIIHLTVHLENNQRVYFTSDNLQQIVHNPPKTTLSAFFELCRADTFANTLLYHEVPTYYTWSNNKWSRRKRGNNVEGYPEIKKDSAIGRVYTIHPNQSECFHLRLLLHHIRGPKSFDSLKTVNGTVFSTFKAACLALGLLESDEQYENTLADAVISQSPSKLRELFAIILVFCQPAQPTVLWDKFKIDLCEDILFAERRRLQDETLQLCNEIFNQGLIQVEDEVVRLCQRYLVDFGLPTPIRESNDISDPYITLRHPVNSHHELSNFLNENLGNMVPDQQYAYDCIIHSVEHHQGRIFFLDAPGGTGKTFLINLILAKIRSTGKIAIAVASSGIAATLLFGGRTAHSIFKLPLNVLSEQEVVCSIRKNSPLGELLQETALIVWDECTMSHRAHIAAIDRTLRDLTSVNKPMGGITFVFAGDFRQTLPVIPKGTRADIVNACLKSSQMWSHVETLNLRTNMRAYLGGGDAQFSSAILTIGDGTIPNNDNYIKIDDAIGKITLNISDLINAVYPDISNITEKSYHWLCERAIITPTNASANEINNIFLDKFEGDYKEYKSIDTVVSVDDAVNYPQEFLNSLDPSGFPPHTLKLKIGSPVMLLRNLHPPNLCNGTRLQVQIMRDNLIQAKILTGPAAGDVAFIPRIPMIPTDLPFQFKRLQFPIKLSFAMTINKSQGQTFKYVGIDLRTDCFSHGQLYVALSRTGDPAKQFILMRQNQISKNIVFSEVLHN